jgi:hypothetical protein
MKKEEETPTETAPEQTNEPSKTAKFIAGAAGTAVTIAITMIAQALAERLGQEVKNLIVKPEEKE